MNVLDILGMRTLTAKPYLQNNVEKKILFVPLVSVVPDRFVYGIQEALFWWRQRLRKVKVHVYTMQEVGSDVVEVCDEPAQEDLNCWFGRNHVWSTSQRDIISMAIGINFKNIRRGVNCGCK